MACARSKFAAECTPKHYHMLPTSIDFLIYLQDVSKTANSSVAFLCEALIIIIMITITILIIMKSL